MLVTPDTEGINKIYQTPNNCAKIEDHPKPRNVTAFRGLGWVRHHDGALRAPQNAGTNTEECTRENGEAVVVLMAEGQERPNVHRIPDATKGQRGPDTKLVGESPSEETDHGKGRVECNV